MTDRREPRREGLASRIAIAFVVTAALACLIASLAYASSDPLQTTDTPTATPTATWTPDVLATNAVGTATATRQTAVAATVTAAAFNTKATLTAYWVTRTAIYAPTGTDIPTATRQFANTVTPSITPQPTRARPTSAPAPTQTPMATPLPLPVVSTPGSPVPRTTIWAPVPSPVAPTALPTDTAAPTTTRTGTATRTPTRTATFAPGPITPSATQPPPVFGPAGTTPARPKATPTPQGGAAGSSSRLFLALGGAAVGLGGLIGIMAIMVTRSRKS